MQPKVDALASPNRYMVLDEAGHASYIDICPRFYDNGGLGELRDLFIAAAPDAGRLLEAADDGCQPGDNDPRDLQALVNHVTVAHLRSVFGLDADDTNLQPATIDSLYGGLYDSYEIK